MTPTQTAKEALDRCFLDVRSRILDIAACLDRIDRGTGAEGVRQDSRLKRVAEAVGLLADGASSRSERVQMLFSLPYDPKWRG